MTARWNDTERGVRTRGRAFADACGRAAEHQRTEGDLQKSRQWRRPHGRTGHDRACLGRDVRCGVYLTGEMVLRSLVHGETPKQQTAFCLVRSQPSELSGRVGSQENLGEMRRGLDIENRSA